MANEKRSSEDQEVVCLFDGIDHKREKEREAKHSPILKMDIIYILSNLANGGISDESPQFCWTNLNFIIWLHCFWWNIQWTNIPHNNFFIRSIFEGFHSHIPMHIFCEFAVGSFLIH